MKAFRECSCTACLKGHNLPFESIDWNEQYGLLAFFLAFIFLCLPITRSGGDESR